MGAIFAFDLDQTIIDSTDIFTRLSGEYSRHINNNRIFDIIGEHINRNLLDKVIRPAVALRGKGVDAILLLTNNSSREYVALVCEYLHREIGVMGKFPIVQDEPMGNSEFPEVDNVFDYVMVRQHKSRDQVDDPPKQLKDIKYMLDALKIPYKDIPDIARRTFFFDDRVQHDIRTEFNQYGINHYIQIMGPNTYRDGVNMGFIKGLPDLSDYRPVTRFFNAIILKNPSSSSSIPPSFTASAISPKPKTHRTVENIVRTFPEKYRTMEPITSGIFKSRGGRRRTKKSRKLRRTRRR